MNEYIPGPDARWQAMRLSQETPPLSLRQALQYSKLGLQLAFVTGQCQGVATIFIIYISIIVLLLLFLSFYSIYTYIYSIR
jgi:hypothetical protein